MNKTDKKSLVIILILAMLFTIMGPAFAHADFNPDPDLEKTKVKTLLLGNHVFLSDGTLWRIDSEVNATLLETGLKDFNYAYIRESSARFSYYAKLKSNGELKLTVTAIDDDKDVKKETTFSNVKKIIEQYSGDYLAYLTYDNQMYFLDPYESDDIGTFVRTATDVESVKGAFYTKNGKTYHVSGKLIADETLTDAWGEYYAIGTTVKMGKYYSMSYLEIRNIGSDFKEFAFKDNINGEMAYISTDGSTKRLGNNSSHQYIGSWKKDEGYRRYYLSGSNVLYWTEAGLYPSISVLFKNVIDMGNDICDGEVIAFVRSDGSVWANKIRQASQCIKLISPSFNKITDLPKDKWYFNAAKYVYNNGIMTGLTSTTFGPNAKLTRGMLVTVLYKMENEPEVEGESKFSDVKDSSKYYYNPVVWAANNKIVNGYKDGRFGATDNITRQDLAVILYNYAKFKEKDTSKTNDLSGFKDKAKVSKYALPAVKWAVGSGVITGNAQTKTINPKGNAARSDTAAMLQKYCINVGR